MSNSAERGWQSAIVALKRRLGEIDGARDTALSDRDLARDTAEAEAELLETSGTTKTRNVRRRVARARTELKSARDAYEGLRLRLRYAPLAGWWLPKLAGGRLRAAEVELDASKRALASEVKRLSRTVEGARELQLIREAQERRREEALGGFDIRAERLGLALKTAVAAAKARVPYPWPGSVPDAEDPAWLEAIERVSALVRPIPASPPRPSVVATGHRPIPVQKQTPPWATPRRRTCIPVLPDGQAVPKGRVYLPVAGDRARMARAAGASVVPGPKQILELPLPHENWESDIEPFLPFFARRTIVPIQPDLIPESSWGSSLANLLTEEAWSIIRRPAASKRGDLCQICGERQRWTECHEIWLYRPPVQGGGIGVQRLGSLATVCENCHLMFHLGLARVQGREQETAQRLSYVNRWSVEDYENFEQHAFDLYERRSRFEWILDLSLVAAQGPLAIRHEWALDGDGWLVRQDRRGWVARTRILGCAFSVSGMTFPPVDPAPWNGAVLPEEGDASFVESCGDGVTEVK